MFKNISVTLLAGVLLLMSGCATVDPIQQKYKDLDASYASGKISAYEYTTAKESILREELERAKAKAQAEIQERINAKRE